MSLNSSSPKSTIDSWLKEATAKLKRAGVDSARLDSLMIIEKVIDVNRTTILASLNQSLDKGVVYRLQKLLDRRLSREPMAYILGVQEFFGRDFLVTPDVLIPRVETETLVLQVIKHTPPGATITELGTGSGAIGITIKLERPDTIVTMTDISPAALKIAKKNANKYLINDVNFKIANLMNDINTPIDVLVANLPYVPSGRNLQPELGFEPSLALFGGKTGLELYGRLFSELTEQAQSPSYVFLEAEPSQEPALKELAGKSGYSLVEREMFAYHFRLNESADF